MALPTVVSDRRRRNIAWTQSRRMVLSFELTLPRRRQLHDAGGPRGGYVCAQMMPARWSAARITAPPPFQHIDYTEPDLSLRHRQQWPRLHVMAKIVFSLVPYSDMSRRAVSNSPAIVAGDTRSSAPAFLEASHGRLARRGVAVGWRAAFLVVPERERPHPRRS